MLITLPNSDIVTYYLSAWSKKITKIAHKNRFKPTVLEGDNVTKSNIIKNIESKDPCFIAFNGHGSPISIAGQDDEVLIELGVNDELLEDKIVHSISCSSGKKLGSKCDANAFIGYDDVFWLPMYRFSTAKPLKDKLAKPVMKSAMEAPIQIVKGKNAGIAYEKSQEIYQKWIDEYTSSSSEYTTEELQTILPCLYWNKMVQNLHGNSNAKC